MLKHLYTLMEDAGALGRYQILQLVTLLFSCILGAGHTLSFIFITSTPDIICPLSSFNRSTFTAAARAIANESTQCGLTLAKQALCPNWTYDTSIMQETIVSKYNLLCDRAYLVPLSVTMYMCGFFIGATMYGYLSDRFGRIKALSIAAFHSIVAGFVATFAPTIIVYIVARFFAGIGTCGFILIIYVYLPECTVPRYRGQVAILINMAWAMSLLSLCFLTYFLRSVTSIDLVLTSLIGVTLAACFVFQESPRWLLVEGHLKRLRKAMTSIARFNGRKLMSMNELLQENVTLNESVDDDNQVAEPVHIKSFFIHPGMRRVSFIIWFNALVVSMVYYGLSTGFSGLGGWNIYVNMTISASLELFGIFLLLLLLRSRNRISLIIIANGILAALLFAATALKNYPSQSFPLAIICLIARSLCADCFSLYAVYVIEVYPTTHRTFGQGLAASVTRVSAMIAPFVFYMERLWKPLPFLVYGILVFIVVLLYLLMPETRNRSQDTVAEAEVMMKRSACAKCLGWTVEEDEADANFSDAKEKIKI